MNAQPFTMTCGGAQTNPSFLGIIMTALGSGSMLFGAIGALHLSGPQSVAVGWAVVQAYIILYLAWYTEINLTSLPVGTPGCAAGTVNAIELGDTGMFSMHHTRIDLVVRQQDWPQLAIGTPQFLLCAGCNNCPQSAINTQPPADTLGVDCSPVLPSFYRSQRVVNAAIGTAVGATVGVVAGAVVGGNIGGGLSAASCAFTGVFAWACLLAVLIVWLIVVLAVTLGGMLGGAVGNAIGASSTPNDIDPTGISSGGTASVPVQFGAYACVFGNILSGSTTSVASGANVMWFVGWVPIPEQNKLVNLTAQTGDCTILFGPSNQLQTGAPFCHTDPDSEFGQMAVDPCTTASSLVKKALESLGST